MLEMLRLCILLIFLCAQLELRALCNEKEMNTYPPPLNVFSSIISTKGNKECQTQKSILVIRAQNNFWTVAGHVDWQNKF